MIAAWLLQKTNRVIKYWMIVCRFKNYEKPTYY